MEEALRQLKKLESQAREQAYDYEGDSDQQRAYQLGALASYSDAIRIVERGMARDDAR
ncbi:hypothetical protein [Lacticaseibacillus saniviri]